MKTISGLGLVAVLLISWLCFIGTDASAPHDDQAMAVLDRFVATESLLRENLLNARLGLLRDYDPLDNEMTDLRQSVLRLREDGIAASVVDPLGNILDQQEALVERFKSDNALLQNSLAYFGLLSGTFSLTLGESSINPGVAALSTAVLNLMLDPAPASAKQVHDSLAWLSAQPTGRADQDLKEGLLVHGQRLYDLLPATDAVLRSVHQLPFAAREDIVRTAITHHQQALRTQAGRYQLLLYSVSLLLLLILIVLGAELRSMLQTLRRRAAFERTMADISMRFVTAGPSDMRGAIETALAELATWVGADRAYFTVSAPREVYAWSRASSSRVTDLLERTPVVSSSLSWDKNEILYFPCANHLSASPEKDALLASGVRGWLRIPSHGGGSVEHMLELAALTKPMIWPAEDLGLLRVAADNIANAVSRERLEREQAKLEASLQRARRMETVGALTSGVAHNFNNIIGAILGHAEMQEAEVTPGSRLARHVQGVRQAAEHARDLVDQILKFGRQSLPPQRHIQLDVLVAETQTHLRAVLPSSTHLVVERIPQAAVVQGDAAQLQQIIMNLCINAHQAMDGPGIIDLSIDIRTSLRTLKLSHGALPLGTYVRLCVHDSGRGIDDDTLASLFEPFFTTRPDGNGLGLATVYEIVSGYGGALNVTSHPGAGSCFEVWLPAASPDRKSIESTTKKLPGEGETVVIVNEGAARLLHDEEIVAALGYEPVGYLRPADALAAFRSAPQRFDAVLIANVSPLAAALDFTATLRNIAPGIPILLAVSHTDLTADLLAAAGVDETIETPITSADLATALPRVLALQPS